ncbi:hypothetical protein K502DRAFT_366904 [Neoconidiobolus thromboides FSU 785]|nr:hypothetical protein K502DRAFT_366904 [Neoconidiobolus thromboides FSU 785]
MRIKKSCLEKQLEYSSISKHRFYKFKKLNIRIVLRTFTLLALLTISSSKTLPNFQQSGCKAIKATSNPQYENLDKRCFVETQPGQCRAADPSYHFDQATSKYIKGFHRGCSDGCLAFSTMQECEAICVKNTAKPATQIKSKRERMGVAYQVKKPKNLSPELEKLDDKCFIKTKRSVCFMMVNSFHFDSAIGKCIEANHSRCSDGYLVFESMKDCESSCVKKSIQMVKKEVETNEDVQISFRI